MMLVEQDVRFDIVPTGGALGAEVLGVDLSAPLGRDLVVRLRQAWLENQVLVFRGQSLSDGQLLTVARAFGEPHVVEVCEYDRTGLLPEIDVISNVVENGKPIGALGAGEAAWHTDMSMFDYPGDPAQRRQHPLRQYVCRLRDSTDGAQGKNRGSPLDP